MKLLLLLALQPLLSAQTCPIQVTALPIKLGVNQSAQVRTSNTFELNRLFHRINSGQEPCHEVAFPEGVVEIDGVVNVFNGAVKSVPSPSGTYAAVTIHGVNREHSLIVQTVPNQPVFRWNAQNLYVSGIFVHDLGFDNTNTKAPYNREQWGLEFRCTENGSGGNSWGFANSQFERLSISHMYVGLGLFTAGNGTCGLWSTHLQDLKFYNSQRNAIYLVGGSIGQPANVLDRIDVLQENHPPPNLAAPGDTVDPAALLAVGAGGLIVNSLDIEGWNSPTSELEIYGGNSTVINNLRIEHAAFTGCNPTIGFFDGDVILNGTSISWDKWTNTCAAYVFSLAGSSASLVVNGLSIGSTTGHPPQPLTLWRVDNPNPPAKIFANSLNLGGIATEWEPSTNSGLTTTLYSRYEIDHMPPPVDKLPPPGPPYLGRSFLLVTAENAGVYTCVRKSGVFKWLER